MNNLATALSDQGKYTEVEQMYGEVVEVRERALGKEHPSTLASMNNLALALRDQGSMPRRSRCIVGKTTPSSRKTLTLHHQRHHKYIATYSK
jgi:hypothetical protein